MQINIGRYLPQSLPLTAKLRLAQPLFKGKYRISKTLK
jgi:hypothetical protein